jgi:hypothetical protein
VTRTRMRAFGALGWLGLLGLLGAGACRQVLDVPEQPRDVTAHMSLMCNCPDIELNGASDGCGSLVATLTEEQQLALAEGPCSECASESDCLASIALSGCDDTAECPVGRADTQACETSPQCASFACCGDVVIEDVRDLDFQGTCCSTCSSCRDALDSVDNPSPAEVLGKFVELVRTQCVESTELLVRMASCLCEVDGGRACGDCWPEEDNEKSCAIRVAIDAKCRNCMRGAYSESCADLVASCSADDASRPYGGGG